MSGARLRGPMLGADRLPWVLILSVTFASLPGTALAQDAASPDGEPRGGWENGAFLLESTDGQYRLTLGGRVQPRYEFRSPRVGENLSSFFLRRIRIDVRGHVFDERLTFRIMPDMARTATLRDGWIDYAFDRKLQVRAGQFVVPFHWQRFLSGNRQFFAERGEPSQTFGFPNGYDAGVAIHGRSAANDFAYGFGVFDGAGRNVRDSNSAGNMVSGRVTWAARGELPVEEPDLARSESTRVSFGAGLQGATRNEARAWDLGRSTTGNPRADWVSGTVDVSVRRSGLSGVVEGYARRVSPDDPQVPTYTGWAHLIGAGFFLVPGRYEVVARFSRLALDREGRDTRERHWGAGMNIYHQGHLWKTHLQAFRSTSAAGSELVILVQAHLQF